MSSDATFWEKGCFQYALTIAGIYSREPEKIMECMDCDSVISFLNETYTILTGKKELVPLENLDQDEKLRLWEVSKKYGEGKKKRTLICRSIYLLNEIIK